MIDSEVIINKASINHFHFAKCDFVSANSRNRIPGREYPNRQYRINNQQTASATKKHNGIHFGFAG